MLIAVARSNTKVIFWMHAIQKLLNRFTWNFYRKCKSIHPLCLWSFTTIFDNQEIEITYKHYSTLNTWATLMKQKLNYSQYVEQEQDIFRYVKNSELTREIRCHSDRIFPNLHQCYQWYSAPPPFIFKCYGVMTWKCFPLYRPLIQRIYRWTELSLAKGQ